MHKFFIAAIASFATVISCIAAEHQPIQYQVIQHLSGLVDQKAVRAYSLESQLAAAQAQLAASQQRAQARQALDQHITDEHTGTRVVLAAEARSTRATVVGVGTELQRTTGEHADQLAALLERQHAELQETIAADSSRTRSTIIAVGRGTVATAVGAVGLYAWYNSSRAENTEGTIDDLARDISELKDSVGSLTDRADDTETIIGGVMRRLSSMGNAIQSLAGRVGNAEESVTHLQKKLKKHGLASLVEDYARYYNPEDLALERGDFCANGSGWEPVEWAEGEPPFDWETFYNEHTTQ